MSTPSHSPLRLGLAVAGIAGISIGSFVQAEAPPGAASWAQQAYQNSRPGQVFYVQPAVEGTLGALTYTPPPAPRAHTPSQVTQTRQWSGSYSQSSTQAPTRSTNQSVYAPTQSSSPTYTGGTQQGTPPAGSRGGSRGSRKPAGPGKPGTSAPLEAPVHSNKGVAEVVPLQEQTSLVNVTLNAGYYSHYMMRGLDVGYRTGIDRDNSSAFAGTNLNVSVGNFSLGFAYWHSLDSYIPNGAGFDGSFGKISNGLYQNDQDFRTPARERYQEYNLLANYSYPITEDLAVTAGMTFIWFSDGRFWANSKEPVDRTMEVVGGLTYTGIPHLHQSLFYYHDVDAFDGGFLEYKLSSAIPLYQRGDFAIAVVPSVTLGYDFSYNGDNNGWNSVEPGVDVPIRLADGLTLNLGVRYNMDLADATGGRNALDRTDDRLWFSAALQYSFPNGDSVTDPILASGKSGKGSIIRADEAISVRDGKWTIVAGAGVRGISTDFKVGASPRYPIENLFNRRRGSGSLGFATEGSDAIYSNGAVFGSSGFGDGTATFAGGDVSDPGSLLNRQATFYSDRFFYNNTHERKSFTSTDDDQPVYPYVAASYELARFGRVGVSAGLGYSFSQSSMDSGTRITGLQLASERHDRHFFTYDFDELFSGTGTDYLVLNGPLFSSTYSETFDYNAFYDAFYGLPPGTYQSLYGDWFYAATVGNYSPQQNRLSIERELFRVAAFRAATLDVDMHSISAPIDVTYDISDKIALKLSFGPTLNVFNVDLRTDTYYQMLAPEGRVRTSGNGSRRTNVAPAYRYVDAFFGVDETYSSRGYVGPTVDAGGTPTGSATGVSVAGASGGTSSVAPASVAPSSTGGKGAADGRSRKLPGTTIAHYTNRYNEQELRWGIFGQLALQADLDDKKRWFLEAFVRYDYISPFSISDGATSAELDASSWGAGIGLGFRF